MGCYSLAALVLYSCVVPHSLPSAPPEFASTQVEVVDLKAPIQVGMTTAQVRMRLGRPSFIGRTETSDFDIYVPDCLIIFRSRPAGIVIRIDKVNVETPSQKK